MIREIITYPDKRLKMRSIEVSEFNNELHFLLNDMLDTMIDKNGIGLASIQIGIPKRVFIINVPVETNKKNSDGDIETEYLIENLIEFINPVILETHGKTTYEEGCLSVPKFYETIERFNIIKVQYFNRFGEKIIEEFDGLKAIAFQHEFDHLEGKLFIEKLSYLKRKKFDREIRNRKVEQS